MFALHNIEDVIMRRSATRLVESLGALVASGWLFACGFSGATEPRQADPSIEDPIDDVVGESFVATATGWAAPGDTIAVERDGTLRIVGGQLETERSLRLRTTRIAFAGAEFTGAPSQITQVTPKQLLLRRGLVQERLLQTRDGLRQQWELLKPFASDFVVEIGVEGADQLIQDDGGVFIGSSALVSAHYGRATWVDHAGARTPVAVEVDGAIVRMTVPAAVIAASQFPATLDPVITAETVMDASVIGPSGALAQMPAMAASGSNFLVVWRDDRNGRNSDVYGIRLSSAGTVQDASAFPIAASLGVQSRPTVAFVNGSYLVAWEDYKSASGASTLRAARVSIAGAVTQLGVVEASTATQSTPRLATRGNDALLIYEEAGTVRAAGYNGTSFGASFEVAPTVGAANPTVAADPGGDYLVVFASGSDIKAQRVSAAGATVAATFDISAAAGVQAEPSAAFAGGNFVVSFTSASDIYATRVNSANTVLDTHLEGTATVGGIALVAIPNIQQRSSIVCAAQCLLVWQDRRNSASYFDIYANVFTPALVATGAESIIASGGGQRGQFEPAIAASGAEFAGVWRDHRDAGAGYVYASRISASGAALDGTGRLLALGANRQSAPSVSHDPLRWLATWGDSRVEGDNIQVARINGGGGVVPGSTTASAAAGQQQQSSAAWDGTSHVVAWSDARAGDFNIYATRIDSAGAPREAAGISICSAANDQFLNDVESGANRTLIVWQDRRGTTFDVYGAIIDNTGVMVASEFPISSATGDQLAASVAFDRVNSVFVVTWQDARAGVNERDIYAARVSPSGQVLDPDGVRISAAPSSQLTPDIAFGSGRFLIVWDDRRPGNADIFGARVVISAGALVVLDPFGIAYTNTASAQTSPAVAFTSNAARTGFVLAWVDARNAATNGLDLFGNIVDPATGAIKIGGANGFVLSASVGDEGEPSISADNSGAAAVALVAYQRLFTGLGLRVVARRVTYTEI
jgi:hypothetical protein